MNNLIKPIDLSLISRRELCRKMNRARSTTYGDIDAGLLTPPISCGARSMAWPVYEIDSINAARIAGKNNNEIRELVQSLVRYRAKIFENLNFAA